VSRQQVLVIGLDGATFKLIDPYVRQGLLPNIAALLARGTRSVLTSTNPPITSAAWPSFATGVNPGKHGIYDFVRRSSRGYEPIPVIAGDRKVDAIWNILSRHGKKVGVVNVPMTYPPERVNGFMISGFPTPPGQDDYAYPSTLIGELRHSLGNFVLQKPKLMVTEGHEDRIYSDICEVTDSQTEVVTFLMDNKEWDFFMTVYDAPDVIAHHFWKYIDPNHPLYNDEGAKRLGDRIQRVYQRLDLAVGRILNHIDDNAVALICSDHGTCSVHYCVYVNNWLINTGLMQIKQDFRTQLKHWLFKRGVHNYNFYRLANMLGFVRDVHFVNNPKSPITILLKNLSMSLSDIDWSRTRAYSLGNFQPVFVNVRGREPQGIVDPEGEYWNVIDYVSKEAQKVKDPRTGKTIFDKVIRGRDIYHGPYVKDAPDLLLYDEKMIYNSHRMFELGSEKLVTLHPMYSGSHDFDGIFLATGQSIKAGQDLHRLSILDVAPTILHILGVPTPNYMDGRVPTLLFPEDSKLAQIETVFEDSTEQRRIRERIRQLAQARRL